MKIFKVTDSIRNIKFDDEIVGQFTKAVYTHDYNGSKYFLIHHLYNNIWEAQPVYILNTYMVIQAILFRDNKINNLKQTLCNL